MLLFMGMLFIVIASALAQTPPVGATEVVELRQADLWSKRAGFEAEILTGNVIFFHEGAYMFCDSAYLFQQTNTFEAFSNVRMEQGDTIFVYGDYLHYEATAAWRAFATIFAWKIEM